MIGETILTGTSARCKQAYNWRDNISLIIGLQSASWWSVDIYCANCWPTISAPIIVLPILARSLAVSFNSANPTWGETIRARQASPQSFESDYMHDSLQDSLRDSFFFYAGTLAVQPHQFPNDTPFPVFILSAIWYFSLTWSWLISNCQLS